MARLVKDDPEGVDAMLMAAPLARPSQMDEVVLDLAGCTFTPEQAARLAPFVSRKVLNSVLEGLDFGQIEVAMVIDLAPFVGSETLDRIASQLPSEALGLDELGELAPFLGPETLEALLFRLVEEREMPVEHLVEIAPFLGRGSQG